MAKRKTRYPTSSPARRIEPEPKKGGRSGADLFLDLHSEQELIRARLLESPDYARLREIEQFLNRFEEGAGKLIDAKDRQESAPRRGPLPFTRMGPSLAGESTTWRKRGPGSNPSAVPAQVKRFFDEHTDRPYKAPEIVPSITVKEGKKNDPAHIETLVRSALVHLVRQKLVKSLGEGTGLYASINMRETAGG